MKADWQEHVVAAELIARNYRHPTHVATARQLLVCAGSTAEGTEPVPRITEMLPFECASTYIADRIRRAQQSGRECFQFPSPYALVERFETNLDGKVRMVWVPGEYWNLPEVVDIVDWYWDVSVPAWSWRVRSVTPDFRLPVYDGIPVYDVTANIRLYDICHQPGEMPLWADVFPPRDVKTLLYWDFDEQRMVETLVPSGFDTGYARFAGAFPSVEGRRFRFQGIGRRREPSLVATYSPGQEEMLLTYATVGLRPIPSAYRSDVLIGEHVRVGLSLYIPGFLLDKIPATLIKRWKMSLISVGDFSVSTLGERMPDGTIVLKGQGTGGFKIEPVEGLSAELLDDMTVIGLVQPSGQFEFRVEYVKRLSLAVFDLIDFGFPYDKWTFVITSDRLPDIRRSQLVVGLPIIRQP